MRKPEGKAAPGWYDAPELAGYIQYWNGKYWTKKKQAKDGFEKLEVLPEFELGRFFFRKPYTSDNTFIGWAIVTGLLVASNLANNASNGELDASNSFSIISGLIDGLVSTTATALFIWVLFLIYLIPRRKKDKQNGHTKQ